VPTSKRSQIYDVQYPRILSRILKVASHEEVVDYVVAGVRCPEPLLTKLQRFVDLECMECRDIQISCIAARSLAEPLEACRPQEGLKSKAPKHPEALGRSIRRAPHMEAFIPVVKSWVSRAGWQGYKSTPTSEGHASRAPN
jgi:hypothetical protein